MRSWLLPLSAVLVGSVLKLWLPDQSVGEIATLLTAYALLLLVVAAIAGMTKTMLLSELKLLWSLLQRN